MLPVILPAEMWKPAVRSWLEVSAMRSIMPVRSSHTELTRLTRKAADCMRRAMFLRQASWRKKDLTIDGDVTMYRKDEVNAGNISSRTGKVTIGNVHMAGSITAEGDIEIGDLTEITGALVSNTGAVNVASLGNVGGNHDALDARQEGFAIWAMDTDQNSGLGFKEGAVINGHIGLGYGADTFSLVNGPTVNGNVYLGGVEDVNAFDTLLVGDDSAFTGDFDLSRSESADAYGNLRIEGGALNLNGGRIFDEDVRETAPCAECGNTFQRKC